MINIANENLKEFKYTFCFFYETYNILDLWKSLIIFTITQLTKNRKIKGIVS